MNALQKLARSNTAQTIYRNAKELSGIRLFNNDTELSHIQVLYLYYLSLYESLYSDLSMGEDFISEEIIKDDIRVEAYLLFKRVNRKNKKLNNNNNKKPIRNTAGADSLIFKRGKSK